MFVVDKKQIRAAIIHEEALDAHFTSQRDTMPDLYICITLLSPRIIR